MITVIGGTGNTGSALVRELSAARVPFRVMSRDVARARAQLGPEVEVVPGDGEDTASLARALKGAQKVYFAVGGTPNLVGVEKAIVDVARAAGVRHLVKLSGYDVVGGPSEIQRWHAASEEHLRRSGVPYTVLGGNFFMQNLLGMAEAIAGGVLPMPTGEGKAALVDARDIGRAAACVLRESGHENRRYELTGPVALSHGEVAAELSRVLGRPVQFVDVPPAAWEQSGVAAGMPAWFAALLTNAFEKMYATSLPAKVTSDVEKLTGRPATPLATFIADHRDGFASRGTA